MSRKYVIINADEVDSVDFDQVDETSADTVRYNVAGTKTFVKFEEISVARDTMRFILSNDIIANGYPDFNANVMVLYDIDRDGENDVFGGIDSLYLRRTSNSDFQENFHPITSEKIHVVFIEEGDNATTINVLEYFKIQRYLAYTTMTYPPNKLVFRKVNGVTHYFIQLLINN